MLPGQVEALDTCWMVSDAVVMVASGGASRRLPRSVAASARQVVSNDDKSAAAIKESVWKSVHGARVVTGRAAWLRYPL